jgi:predicted aspartyl protease
MSSNTDAAAPFKVVGFIAVCGVALSAGSSAYAQVPAACSVAGASKNQFEVQVPFEVIDGRIYVQADVNGQGPRRFAVDTGASGLGRADSSLVAELGLKLEKPVLNSDGIKTAEADSVRISSLALGGLVRRDLQVITRDYNSKMSPEAAFAGIIARDFFHDGLLVIDYPRKLLSFSRGLALSPEQTGTLQYERPFRIPVSVGPVSTVGNLDTGANVAFVLPQALFEQVSNSTAEAAGLGQLANAQVETKRSTVSGPFRIGNISVSNVEVRVSDKYPELLVGAHTLQRFKVLIDQRSKRVAVCP